MAKQVKGNSSRKPPEPTDSPAAIEDWMNRIMPDLQPTVRRLHELIQELIPDLQYALKWRKAHYGVPEQGWVIELVAYDVSVNAVFHGGADFDEPPPLGDTGRSRYAKFRSEDEVDAPEVRRWIEQAADTPGWK